MTHFTESKGEYVGGQSGSFYSGSVVPGGHDLPTDTFTTTNTPGWTLLWNTCKEKFKISKKQHIWNVPGKVYSCRHVQI